MVYGEKGVPVSRSRFSGLFIVGTLCYSLSLYLLNVFLSLICHSLSVSSVSGHILVLSFSPFSLGKWRKVFPQGWNTPSLCPVCSHVL